jgi:hypothetical protein
MLTWLGPPSNPRLANKPAQAHLGTTTPKSRRQSKGISFVNDNARTKRQAVRQWCHGYVTISPPYLYLYICIFMHKIKPRQTLCPCFFQPQLLFSMAPTDVIDISSSDEGVAQVCTANPPRMSLQRQLTRLRFVSGFHSFLSPDDIATLNHYIFPGT